LLIAETRALSRSSAQTAAFFTFRLKPVNPFRQKKRGKKQTAPSSALPFFTKE
jgi:hypothetical protein